MLYDESRYLWHGKVAERRFEKECLAEYAEGRGADTGNTDPTPVYAAQHANFQKVFDPMPHGQPGSLALDS